MNWKKIQNQNWFPYTVAVCTGVILYTVLANLPSVLGALQTVGGYFGTIFLGGIIAYLINPCAKFMERTVCRNLKKGKWMASTICALVLLLCVFVILFLTILPQLYNSVRTFVSNIDTYIKSLEKLLESSGLAQISYFQNAIESSRNILDNIGKLLTENLEQIVAQFTNIGKGIANFCIALILSLYILAEKEALKKETQRLMNALFSDKANENLRQFFHKCDSVMTSYITCSLLESIIVGSVNALFMHIAGMSYIGLVSVIVAITNLIPTFGPMIGGVLGAFILLLVDPMQALIFIIFTSVLQTVDGYMIKPKLFGDSLGVSGLLILIAVLVFGKIFGVIGIILSIPAAAILEYAYRDLFLPALERRKQPEQTRK